MHGRTVGTAFYKVLTTVLYGWTCTVGTRDSACGYCSTKLGISWYYMKDFHVGYCGKMWTTFMDGDVILYGWYCGTLWLVMWYCMADFHDG